MSGTEQTSELPLFYSQIRILDTERDKSLRLLPPPDYRFAADTNAIPLVAEELFAAQAHYPIVFAGNDEPLPVAIVGLRNGENLFVDADGAWRPDTYLPLYVRRHPFIFIDGNDGRLHLGVESNSPRWSSEDGRPLFEAGEPTALTRGMLEFCTAFRRQHAIAAALGKALREHELLTEYRFTVNAAGSAHSVTGCNVVAEDKLAALADDVFLEWRRAGWLPLITAHLLSLRQWESLGRIAAARPAAALAA